MAHSTKWLMEVPEDKRAEYLDTIKHSTIVRTQLVKVLEHEIKQLDNISRQDYTCPSWAYKQADRLGELRAYRKLLTLVKL